MKPVRRLCYMFLWTWRCTKFNSIPSILILPTNKNIPLIYSVTICQQKTKDCAPSRSFQHKLQYLCFYMFLVFHNQSPLITMFIKYPKDAINKFIIQKLNLLVVIDFRFTSAFCMCNERWIHTWGSNEISTSPVSWNLMWISLKQFYPFKDF